MSLSGARHFDHNQAGLSRISLGWQKVTPITILQHEKEKLHRSLLEVLTAVCHLQNIGNGGTKLVDL